MKLIIHTDGASRGNPGEAGIGALIEDTGGGILLELAEYIGRKTNNEAEYTALIRALEEGLRLGGKEVQIYADSELLVKQVNGDYRVRAEGLFDLFRQVLLFKKKFDRFSITHIPRKENKKADQLANLAIDRAKKE